MYYIVSNDYLAHHGVKGQKWGVRRYQNEDGSLTSSGKRRYGVHNELSARSYRKALERMDNDAVDQQAAYKKHAVKADEYGIKAYKANMKGNSKKADKYALKSTEHAILRDEHANRVKNIDSQMWKTIAKASEMGFDVAMTKKPTLNKGIKLATVVLGPLATAPVASIKSNKYKKYGYDYIDEGHKIRVRRGEGRVSVEQ